MDMLFSDNSDIVWIFIKIAFLVVIALYVVFAYVIVKQVKLMNETLEVGFEHFMKYISYAHLAAALMVLILAVFIL